MIIDFHNHFYPPEYLDAIREDRSNLKISTDSDGNPVLGYTGDYNIVVPGHRDIAYRQTVIEEAGVDKQVVTFTSPGTDIESADQSVRLARIVNNALGSIVAERGDRFAALATLPMKDPRAACEELERAMDDLDMKGFMLFGNVDGVALSDERFEPLYQKASDRKAVFYIHPTKAAGIEAMTDYWLLPLVGFTFDTTLAAAKLVFSGVVERFPGIRWVLAHLGGAIPYLAERFDRGYEAYEECRKNISRPPSEYLRNFYYDTVNFDPKALQLAIDFAGADHVVAGSDYPHQIGSIEKMIQCIDELGAAPSERAGILGENAARLLEL